MSVVTDVGIQDEVQLLVMQRLRDWGLVDSEPSVRSIRRLTLVICCVPCRSCSLMDSLSGRIR
jgi:hypothetical protein